MPSTMWRVMRVKRPTKTSRGAARQPTSICVVFGSQHAQHRTADNTDSAPSASPSSYSQQSPQPQSSPISHRRIVPSIATSRAQSPMSTRSRRRSPAAHSYYPSFIRYSNLTSAHHQPVAVSAAHTNVGSCRLPAIVVALRAQRDKGTREKASNARERKHMETVILKDQEYIRANVSSYAIKLWGEGRMGLSHQPGNS